MAKAVITMEDTQDGVSFLTEIEGYDEAQGLTPAVSLTFATRALYDAGLLTEAAEVSVRAAAAGEPPIGALLKYMKGKPPE